MFSEHKKKSLETHKNVKKLLQALTIFYNKAWNLFTYINTIEFVDTTLEGGKKRRQMISFANTDLAERGELFPTSNQPTNQPKPSSKSTLWSKQKGLLFRYRRKYILRLLSNRLFSCIKDPKHLMPPATNKIKRKNKNNPPPKPLGQTVPGKKIF